MPKVIGRLPKKRFDAGPPNGLQCLVSMRLLFGLFAVLSFAPLRAQKTDTIHLYNGDKIVAEIKELKLGLLRLSTQYMSIVYVQWDQVETIRTDKSWLVNISSGAHYEGLLLKDERLDHLRIADRSDTVSVQRMDIVELARLQNRIWARIDGNINFGLSFQKVNELSQLTIGGNASYRNRRSLVSLTFNSVQSDQNDGERSSKQDLELSFERQLRGRWYSGVSFGPEQNIQLGTQLRFKGNFFIGDYLIKTNHYQLQLQGGLQANNETSVGQVQQDNTEVFLGFVWKGAAYQTPKMNLTWATYYYDNLVTDDRFRFTTDLSLSYEVIKDMTVGVTGYYSVDTEPLDGQGHVDDYRTGLTLGYTF